MNIIFAGTPDFAATALQKLLNSQHKVFAVYTQPDRKSGRGMKLQSSAVKSLAMQHNLPIFQPLSLRNDEVAQRELFAFIEQHNVDLMVVAAYGLLLPSSVLQAFPLGCVNIHASLLPKWRGAAPIARSIENGDSETGISIMQMAAGLDTGDILLSESLEISEDDNAEILTQKLAILGSNLIVKTLDNLPDFQKNAVKQDDKLASYAHKLEKSEAVINWENSAVSILRKIKAFNPFPGTNADFSVKGKSINLKIWDAEISNKENQLNSDIGELIINKTTKTLSVRCGDGNFLNLKIIQKAGSKKVSAKEFISGLN